MFMSMNRLSKLNETQRAEFPRRIAANDAAQPGWAAAWQILEDKLCDHAGHGVVPQDQDLSQLEHLLAAATLTRPGHVRVTRMAPSECHANAARLWAQSRGSEKIWTGFALSTDGLWRQHSWADDGHGIIETTEPRISYFGVGLSMKDSVKTLVANCDVTEIDPAVFQSEFWNDVMAILEELAAAEG